jgi:uncharacterized membrane protein YgcG
LQPKALIWFSPRRPWRAWRVAALALGRQQTEARLDSFEQQRRTQIAVFLVPDLAARRIIYAAITPAFTQGASEEDLAGAIDEMALLA